MDAIRQWAFSLCAAMVACGLCQMLLPSSGLEKVFRTTVSVFFLCCLLSPVVLRSPELRIEITEYAQADIEQRAARVTDVVGNQTAAAASRELRKIVEEKLVQMGINYRDITININTNGQSGDEPPVVEITADQIHSRDHDQIRAELQSSLGLDVRLGYAEAETGEEG